MAVPRFTRFLLCCCAAAVALAADAPPLPELRTDATDGGSVFYVRNSGTQPLTAFLIELVNYPGSYFALGIDEPTSPVAPGATLKIPTTNMTVGAEPEYVKLRAAVYADGTSAGLPEKVAQLLERRKFVVSTTRELMARIQKGSTPAELRAWADSLPPAGKPRRGSQEAINQAAGRAVIGAAVAELEKSGSDALMARLRASEQALAAARPSEMK